MIACTAGVKQCLSSMSVRPSVYWQTKVENGLAKVFRGSHSTQWYTLAANILHFVTIGIMEACEHTLICEVPSSSFDARRQDS